MSEHQRLLKSSHFYLYSTNSHLMTRTCRVGLGCVQVVSKVASSVLGGAMEMLL